MTTRTSRALVVLIAVAGLAHARAASADMIANGKTLTVTTTNAVATFAGPDLVGFVNSLTSETYLKNPSAGELTTVHTIVSTGQALQLSDWTIAPEPGTGDPLATITANDSVRHLTLTVKIDAARQEIVLKLLANVSNAGLRDATWSVAGLDLVGGRLIVPADTGIVYDAAHPGIGAHHEYPNDWQAQMAVYESALGGLLFYSTDQQLASKWFLLDTRGNSSVDLGLGTQAVAPFPSATAVPTIEWRMKAVAGDWRAAATIYRDWLLANRPPVTDTNHPWVSNIRAVVKTPVDSSLLNTLATKVVPSQTLIYLWDWRQSPYDVNYPNYTPSAGVASFVTAAHNLGFKVMLHLDLIGVSPGNGDYAPLQQYQVRTSESLQLMGWKWDEPPSTPQRFAYISPAAAAYRTLFINRVASGIAGVNPDALHLDISAPMFNDGNGLISGLTYPQGSAQLHQDLIAAFPAIALAGEGENDILYRYQSFAQAWHLPVAALGHPIADFLFSPHVQYYGHLSQPTVQDPAFKIELEELERRAVLPMWPVGSSGDLDTTDPDNARFAAILQSWQAHAFQLSSSANWSGALVRYDGLANTTATLTDTGNTIALTAAGSTLFQLSHDANQVTTGSFVRFWPAFDATKLYGLDPSRRYFLDPIARPSTTHATNLPLGVRVGQDSIVTTTSAHLAVTRTPSSSFDFLNLMPAHLGVRFQGVDTPLGNGAIVNPSGIVAGGVFRSGLFIHPPFQGQIGGETFAEYTLFIPANATLQFSVAVADNANCTDGVTFRVATGGTELWRRHVNRTGWHDGIVNLAAYAGTTIPVRIVSNPGPGNNPNCDWSVWSNVALGVSQSALAIDVPIALQSGSVYSGFDGDGSFTYTPPLAGTVTNLPVPGQFTIFTQAGAPVSNGTNLTSVAFDVSRAAHGDPAQPGAVFGAGAIGPATSGGVTKNPTIWAHPPDGGRTILSWVLAVPNVNLQLGWSAGIGDGALSEDGIDFIVRINGIAYWTLTTQANHWNPGSVDLSKWKGQNILLELVTDSRPHFIFDWAYWADLVVTNSGVSCSFGVPSAVQIGALGGAFTIPVTAPATCPWAATSPTPWITITAGSGTGNGNVGYTAAANVGLRRSGSVIVAGQTVTITQAMIVPLGIDVDGDRKTDRVVWRPSNGVWYAALSDGGAMATGWGVSTDVDVLGDYDGDGMADFAVWRPSTGTWFVLRSSDNAVQSAVWGTNGDIPIAGDVDGDGKADFVIYRPGAGAWFVNRSGGGTTVTGWGLSTDQPLLGDYDGDGRADLAIYRPSSGVWYILNSSGGSTILGWGTTGDIPVVGDYDGDGKADPSVFRPANGQWFVSKSTGGILVTTWGMSGDVPVSGDHDGDGKSDFIIFRGTTGVWYTQFAAGGNAAVGWGVSGDEPSGRVPGS